MATLMDVVVLQATTAALESIEGFYQDADSRREAARRVSEALQSQTLLRIDEQDHGSRPRW